MEHDNEPVDFHTLGGIVSKAKKAGNSYSGKDILSILPNNGSNRVSVGLSRPVCSLPCLQSRILSLPVQLRRLSSLLSAVAALNAVSIQGVVDWATTQDSIAVVGSLTHSSWPTRGCQWLLSPHSTTKPSTPAFFFLRGGNHPRGIASQDERVIFSFQLLVRLSQIIHGDILQLQVGSVLDSSRLPPRHFCG